MKMPALFQSFRSRLAVCSWSLRPSDPANLVTQLLALGLTRVQLDLDPLREHAAVWGKLPALFADAGISVVSGMFRTVGEDYTTLETIRRTGGLVPDATWDQNWNNLQATASIARQLGLDLVMTHAGFLPHEPSDPAFAKMIGRMRQVARLFAGHGLTLCCETGQETATSLVAFLEHLDEPNVAVNFDPANMLLYNNGDPIAALRTLGSRVRSCHLKDATAPLVPGTWGNEVPVGTGQVDWPAFFTTMAEIRFPGFFCFEREAGSPRGADIAAGRHFVEKLLGA
ncbi:MAG: sugar phosphate isomerase/epimerase [Verrucomicrobia bacterium]|nr:sugar phosphate isomerase/epimerase [Verrucomicrobiota bacterium]